MSDPTPPPPSPRPLYQQAMAQRQPEPKARAKPAQTAKGAAASEATAAIGTRPDRLVMWLVLGAGVLFTFTAWVSGATPLALVLGITFACVAQGLWRGAAEVAGLLAGTLVALLVAGVLGKALEGMVAGVLGTSGMQNRIISIAMVFLVVLIGVTAGASFAARRFTKSRPHWQRWNHFVGGGIGLVEGGLLAMAVLWVPLALEPVAQSRVAAERDGGMEAGAAAHGVLDFAKSVRDSSLGRLAESTNPVQGSAILAMAEDFAIVSRSPEAMAFFVETPVMRHIQELPSVTKSIELFKNDPEMKAMFSQSSAVSSSTLMAIMRSPVVLEVLDETTVVDDLAPTVGEIAEALAAAKAKAVR